MEPDLSPCGVYPDDPSKCYAVPIHEGEPYVREVMGDICLTPDEWIELQKYIMKLQGERR